MAERSGRGSQESWSETEITAAPTDRLKMAGWERGLYRPGMLCPEQITNKQADKRTFSSHRKQPGGNTQHVIHIRVHVRDTSPCGMKRQNWASVSSTFFWRLVVLKEKTLEMLRSGLFADADLETKKRQWPAASPFSVQNYNFLPSSLLPAYLWKYFLLPCPPYQHISVSFLTASVHFTPPARILQLLPYCFRASHSLVTWLMSRATKKIMVWIHPREIDICAVTEQAAVLMRFWSSSSPGGTRRHKSTGEPTSTQHRSLSLEQVFPQLFQLF